MTYNGAKGETQQAMAKTLELQGISLQEINSANAALIAAVQNADDKVQLNIANSLWAKQDINFNPDFLQTTENFYNATVTNLDFSDPGAVNAINDWVKQSTNGKIDRIVQQINPDDVMFLINAIYFKGKWTKEFEPEQTTQQPFYLTAGEEKQHPLMSQSGEYKYYENKKFQAVSLPYGNDGRLSLYVFLPSDNSSLTAFYQDLNADNWEKWMAQFRNRQGSIRLPRFKINYELTLNDTLKALGMGVAFEPKADFSGIGDNLALSEVKHKTFVEVNEEGTEAAAATSVGITLTSAPSEQPFQMNVDRPFFCAIRDNQTGTVLFMGSIVNPQ
jgi:serpin B